MSNNQSLDELRARAKAMGIKGYGKLRKAQLQRVLAQTVTTITPAAGASRREDRIGNVSQTATRRRTPTRRAAPAETAAPVTVRGEPADELVSQDMSVSGEEECVAEAKYAVALPGLARVARPATTDLGEDINRLPPLGEPALYLLPQKPGILHAYWVLPHGELARRPGLKLRLCRHTGNRAEVWQEIDLPADRGSWYFHVGGSVDTGELYVDLGYYRRDGAFVGAIRRGFARLPSLYASERTDRRWWISPARFRTMYLRAGGFAHDPRLGWAGAASSPGGMREHLAWPGSVSSR